MRVAIIGAGAIGAGFLYPALIRQFDVTLYDLEVRALKYKREVVGEGSLEFSPLQCHISALVPNSEIEPYDFVFVSVGCSNFLDVVKHLGQLKSGIVVCCDNLYNPAGYARKVLPDSLCSFTNGFPWVSCFRTDGGFLCEDGYLSVDRHAFQNGLAVIPEIDSYLDNETEYLIRLVLHCGTHAVVAYNGWADGCLTIPEAIRKRNYTPMWDALKEAFPDDEKIVDRERERFEDERFPDPVDRVGRNPHRKLIAGERLPRLWQYISPINYEARTLVRDGLINAVRYGRMHDPVVMIWRQLTAEKEFIKQYSGLEGF